ncbi:MAG TPA: Cro/CI family transcriptional regulator [Pseudolabrys sp.]|nr:Cro/CI family transcriptional regulator [Pseudolabrys sp.]
MTDRGLEEAIRAVGGVTELARRIGISQPSVSNWTRVPAERVLTVEAVTGVARAILRPDLYDDNNKPDRVDEVDLARAQEYALLAALLARAPDAALLGRLSTLRGDPTPLGLAHVGLADAASRADAGKVEREFFDLFIGIGRGELMPYGSYYIAGFLHERPLARLREDLGRLGIERVEAQYESEDHAVIECEIMSGLAGGQFSAPADAGRELFDKHLAPWLGRFFADLERAQSADFYRSVGALGRTFMAIESEAFALAD